jgi:hypothetical protein
MDSCTMRNVYNVLFHATKFILSANSKGIGKVVPVLN